MRTFLIALFFTGCVILPDPSAPSRSEYQEYTSSQGIRYICPVDSKCRWTIDDCTKWSECRSPDQPGAFSYFLQSEGMGLLHIYKAEGGRYVMCQTLVHCSDRDRRRNEGLFCGNVHGCVPRLGRRLIPPPAEKIPPPPTPSRTAPASI